MRSTILITGGSRGIGAQGELADFSAERISWTVDVNVTGALRCMREASRRMSVIRGGPGGSIINVSSRASTNGSPFEYIDYAATKGAIDAATLGLSKELGSAGVSDEASYVNGALVDIGGGR